MPDVNLNTYIIHSFISISILSFLILISDMDYLWVNVFFLHPQSFLAALLTSSEKWNTHAKNFATKFDYLETLLFSLLAHKVGKIFLHVMKSQISCGSPPSLWRLTLRSILPSVYLFYMYFLDTEIPSLLKFHLLPLGNLVALSVATDLPFSA